MANINSYNEYVSTGPEFPARNLLFALNAKIHNMDSDTILFSSFVDDVFYDQTPNFYKRTSEDISLNTDTNTEVLSLFSDYSRAEIINIIKNEENFDKTDFLRKTFSCYSPVKKKHNIGFYKNFENPISFRTFDAHCHSCNACFRRNVSLMQLGYFINFENSDILDMYYKRAAFEDKLSNSYKNSILAYHAACQFFNENRKKFK
jgi:7-cyano-7-deazaguanine synthase in queuosine biosynthesis